MSQTLSDSSNTDNSNITHFFKKSTNFGFFNVWMIIPFSGQSKVCLGWWSWSVKHGDLECFMVKRQKKSQARFVLDF